MALICIHLVLASMINYNLNLSAPLFPATVLSTLLSFKMSEMIYNHFKYRRVNNRENSQIITIQETLDKLKFSGKTLL